MLTLATISDIPSYNRLAVGDRGTALRGVFLEDSASRLVKALRSGTVTLEFSIDFFERTARYVLPLASVATQTAEFNACLGDADMSWMRH